jgi:predicted phosphodiesterase
MTPKTYGVISDIHGNLHALEAVLAALRAAAVDRILCAGDTVGYGPFPNECVRRVLALPGIVVAGNHDLMAIGSLPTDGLSEFVRSTQEWTRSALEADVRLTLAQLPPIAEVGPVVMVHAALDSPTEYIRTERQATAQLERLNNDWPDAQLLVLGHTHRQWLFHERSGTLFGKTKPLATGTHLLNPGSVGQSRQLELLPRARYAILDANRRRVHFFAIEYDRNAARRALVTRGLPARSIHLRPAVLPVARRYVDLGVLRGRKATHDR